LEASMTLHEFTHAASQISSRRSLKLSLLVPPLVALVWFLSLGVFGSADMARWARAEVIEGTLLLLVAGALFMLPGLALLRVTWPALPLHWSERLSLAGGLSLALPPLLLQATHLLRFPWNSAATMIYVGVAVLALVLLPVRRWWHMRHITFAWPVLEWHDLLLGGLTGAALLIRLYIMRDLPAGMWADSYHHTVIVQLLADNQGLFSSWQPYAPLATFTYHYGFHANVVFFHWLSGVPVTQSVLVVGQIINVVTLMGAYLLATRLSGSRTVGLIALALTGFVGMLPAFYVNWGRYTQLTGQAILPAVLICWMLALESQRLRVGAIVLAVTTTAGLLLTHYIVTIFAALFVGAYVLLLLARTPRWATAISVGGRALVTGTCALLLAAPWLVTMLNGRLAYNAQRYVNRSIDTEYINKLSALLPLMPFYVHPLVAVLAVVSTVVALALRRWRVLLLLLWSQLLIMAVVPQVFGLPGAGLVTNFAAYIALYITVVPLAAYGPGVMLDALTRRHVLLGQTLLTGALIATSVWGVRQQQALIAPGYMLFTSADAEAMEWIKANIPPDALFLVNMDPAYNNTMFIGSDGGWWIPLLTQRQTTLPPMIQGHERFADPERAQQLEDLGFALRAHPLPSPEAIQRLRDAGVRYLYRGANVVQTDKSPGAPPLAPLVDAEVLRRDRSFRVVYDRDNVVIFELQPQQE
jgi:hypothetical protein